MRPAIRLLFVILLALGTARAQEEALPGAPEFAGALAQYAAYILPEAKRGRISAR